MIRILLLADSHLGFDLPVRPRIERRRRGHDFLANYAAALAPAFAGEVDCVVHAGDVFDRPTVPSTVAYQALEPLRQIADRGVPVFVVPGNHERARIPHDRFARHANVHVFDRPRTYRLEIRGLRVALSGFPFERSDVRQRFTTLLQETQWAGSGSDIRLLCMHQCLEGATVGPANFTFTTASDVVRTSDLPLDCRAVLSGHIHRHQVLTRDLRGKRLGAPVMYPGSIERTSLAEADEPKGFMIVEAGVSDARWTFRPLPARPMIRRDLRAAGHTSDALASVIRSIVDEVPADAVLSIRVLGALSDAQLRTISAARLRALVPPTMNVEIRPAGGYGQNRQGVNHRASNLALEGTCRTS